MGVFLKRGATGEQVGELQRKLVALSYGSYMEPYGVDNSYGPKTELAVSKFQADYGLKVTGICDPTTWEKLFSALKANGDQEYVIAKSALDKTKDVQLVVSGANDFIIPDPKGKLFILNLVTDTYININFTPADVSDDVSMSPSMETVRGRSIAYIGYNTTETPVGKTV